jgi:hypothetical protein
MASGSGTISQTINLLDTIRNCGSKHSFSPLKVALVFRTLLLIDALHDYTDKLRTSLSVADTSAITLKLYQSYKRDIYKLIKDHSTKLNNDEKTFLSKLLVDNDETPNIYYIDDADTYTNNSLTNLQPKPKMDKILARLCFHNESVKTMSKGHSTQFGIIPDTKFPTVYDNTQGITSDKTDGLYTLKKFSGSILLTKSISKKYNTNNPLYVLCSSKIKNTTTNNEYIDIIKILIMFFDITSVVSPALPVTGAGKNSIQPDKLHEYVKTLMGSLKFKLYSQFNFNNNDDTKATPWGFIHNIICSKINNYDKPPCTTNTSKGYYPDITLSIDSEKTQESKNYLKDQLMNFYGTHTNTPEATNKKIALINNLNEKINTQINNTSSASNTQANTDYNYILESAFNNIDYNKSSFTLARTAGTNFDAAPGGNLNATLLRLDDKFSTINHISATYTYDIIVKSGDIKLLHLKYTPNIAAGETKLHLRYWFNDTTLSDAGISHNVLNSSSGGGGFSLARSIGSYKSTKNLLNLHFKTLTDSGQVFCYYLLQSYEAKNIPGKAKSVYIFHTNDTFCGAISSIILPGTVIERSDHIKQDMKHSNKEFYESLYSGPNNVYCSIGTDKENGTYKIAQKNIGKFQTISKTNKHTLELTTALLNKIEDLQEDIKGRSIERKKTMRATNTRKIKTFFDNAYKTRDLEKQQQDRSLEHKQQLTEQAMLMGKRVATMKADSLTRKINKKIDNYEKMDIRELKKRSNTKKRGRDASSMRSRGSSMGSSMGSSRGSYKSPSSKRRRTGGKGKKTFKKKH